VTWTLPQHGSRCFDMLPATVERLLGNGGAGGLDLGSPLLQRTYDHVVLIYLDAFGWSFLERHGEHALLRDAPLVEKLTSQFPSTTTAHTTTIHSGLPVGEHGLYEWFVYEPRLDRLIAPLLFSFAGDRERESLNGSGLTPEDIFPPSFYDGLDVVCHVVHPAVIADSSASHRLLRGASVHGYGEPEEGIALLGRELASAERGYGILYLPEVDFVMHHQGPDDPDVAVLFDRILSAIDEAVRGSAFPSGTLVLLTADHGMAAVSPERSVYVNAVWRELHRSLQKGADGKPLAPAGSCRDLFLHALPERVDDVVERLGELLAEVAEVQPVERLLADGVFGPSISAALRARLANVAVLPYAGEAVYWLEAGKFEQRFRGQHGGLTATEMEIPLVGLVTD
jgi:hypothetical protein